MARSSIISSVFTAELLLADIVAEGVGLGLHHREAVGVGLLRGRVAAAAGEGTATLAGA